MTLEQDLTAIWERLVSEGQIRNQFAGPGGRWLESGIRMSVEGPEHYATDIASGEDVRAGLLQRALGPAGFVLQLNQYRALKPRAKLLGLGRQRPYPADVNDCLFACQDPANPLSLLQREISVRTTLKNYQWAAVHNALPVEKNGHFLWVPVQSEGAMAVYPHWVQALTLPLLEDFLALAFSTSNAMTFYNAMHAGGSVNHIHYHSVYRHGARPIEASAAVSRGGRLYLDRYPASGVVYAADATAEQIWGDVATLQARGIPINLIHAGDCTYLIARDIEHEVVAEFPEGILAGMELSGTAITTEQSYYDTAEWETLHLALSKSTVATDRLIELLES